VIRGAHVILYCRDAEADRAFLADLLRLPAADAGGGWTILQLPQGEVAVHPAEASGAVELYLVCDDVEETVGELTGRGFWGLIVLYVVLLLAMLADRLPGGGRLGLYEARHPTAFDL